jgi:hypothetical protein
VLAGFDLGNRDLQRQHKFAIDDLVAYLLLHLTGGWKIGRITLPLHLHDLGTSHCSLATK